MLEYLSLCGRASEKYCFIDGKTVKVHVPVDIAIGKLMIVGAYPSAIFETIKKIKDIPVGDHSHPFSNEKYFDGSRIRTVESGRELDEYYLSKLGISRNDCWITNLVKVFLFKPGHINKYNEIRPDCTTIATRNQYRIFAIRSLEYFTKEVELAKPKIILTLGSEVTAAIHQCSEKNLCKD
ncbi:MAG: hypothetical protein U5Q03_00090 [Bacteroidota bacterium]|nr:hypothetical protein [Bacteroidota bacterium]